MNRYKVRTIAAIALLMMPAATLAQTTILMPQQVVRAYNQPQLDQMLAPVALYPDSLLVQMLMAASYPLEVVEAERWLQNPGNNLLNGEPLAAALQQQPWDPSVKSMVAFPQVLAIMNSNLQWTEQLGEAFITNQPAVMNSIQRLRGEALAAGTLITTPQQTVSSQGGIIAITPAQAGTVYVPYYNPATVYGTWAYPTYAPFAFPVPDYAYSQTAISYGTAIIIVTPLWGWHHCDWRHHRIDIDGKRFEHLGGEHRDAVAGIWQHDPAHRHIPISNSQMHLQPAQTPSSIEGKKVIQLRPGAIPQQPAPAAPAHTIQQQHSVAPVSGMSSQQSIIQPSTTRIPSNSQQSGKVIIQPGNSNSTSCIGGTCNNSGTK